MLMGLPYVKLPFTEGEPFEDDDGDIQNYLYSNTVIESLCQEKSVKCPYDDIIIETDCYYHCICEDHGKSWVYIDVSMIINGKKYNTQAVWKKIKIITN